MGDRVRAVVLSQEDYSRFSLSTAELEEQPGDMLRDKVPRCKPCFSSEHPVATCTGDMLRDKEHSLIRTQCGAATLTAPVHSCAALWVGRQASVAPGAR